MKVVRSNNTVTWRCRKAWFQGRSDGVGVYPYIYTPKISNRFFRVWDINTCFEIAM